MSKSSLSALVVAHNEELNLPDCLGSLSFADEIVVVLDKCTDRSKEITLGYTNKIIEGSWEIEGPRRNVGIEACTSDWILEVDADERVTKQLAEEILRLIQTSKNGYFQIPFHNYIGDKLVINGWGAYIGVQSGPRLFARGSKRWGDQRVHPEITLPELNGRLDNAMIHYVDDNISDMIQRLDRYSTDMARDRLGSEKLGSFSKNLIRMPARFFKCFIQRKGYKEGLYGFLIALFAALLPMLSYIKAKLEN